MRFRALRFGVARGLVLGYVLSEIAVAVGTEWARATGEILGLGVDLALDSAADVLGSDDPGGWLEENAGRTRVRP